MKTRRFHVYAGQEDLQDILKEFQEKFDVYYVPAYSDKGPVSFRDATSLEGLGTNVSGSHLGNRQVLAFMDTTVCLWREYRWADYEKSGTRHTSLCEGNTERIDIDLNGVYQGKAIFPTQIAAMHYENETAKRLYDGLKRIVRGSTGPHWEIRKIPYEEVRQLLEIDFDPEGSMFCAYSREKDALADFILRFKEACEDRALISDLFSMAELD